MTAFLKKTALMLAAGATALAAAAGAASANPAQACWLEVGSGRSHGVLQAYAAPRLAGSFELRVRQDGGNGELVAEQSGTFSPYNFWPTNLSRVVVGANALRPHQPDFWTNAWAARPGTTIIASSNDRRAAPGALPVQAYGFRADLRVYDTSGRLICSQREYWR
ncbi:hypothetical protein F1654_00930 [Alkalicaulis satelles]|uniref:Uncharacterized protein n=1 Tax=Alkalicaulis satelles TaxID=2609175 RepID=A0A5M6ZKW5_9PROT|nr:hypothetical protein [Alkalicaulis satelles]KAA5804605.1 hypothetical protein F1654_00930 [Alkalicaulis satelles]